MSRTTKPFGDVDAVNPHVTGGRSYSPLSSLIRSALRRYGDVSAGSAYPETGLMLLEFANVVVEEMNTHPYKRGEAVDYYIHLEDVREIPDAIVIAGMLFYYAEQQVSQKAGTYRAEYYMTMNRIMHRLTLGQGPYRVRPMDGGSNLRDSDEPA